MNKSKGNSLYEKKVIEEYYDKCQKYYTLFWSDNESLGLHYGFWDSDTKSRKEALLNQYREIIKLLQPESNELILDAGCGVGGASIWLAKHTNAKFIGITLSSKQVELAKKYSIRYKVSGRVEFYKMDFFNSGFNDETFDKIFTIESFCYSYPNPTNLLKEMHRVLKKGGKILMSDGFLLRHPKNNQEIESLKKFYLGWKLNGGNSKDEILGAFKKSGFKNVRFIDKTESIKKNVNQIFLRGVILYLFLRILRSFKLISQTELEHTFAVINQKRLVEAGIMGYGIFYAEK